MNRDEYQLYLQSSHWKKLRCLYINDNTDAKCNKCGSVVNLNLHHLNYDNLWHEQHKDLEVLCELCHYYVHFKSDEGRIGTMVKLGDLIKTILPRKRMEA